MPSLRRLRDIPLIDDLERKAVLDRRWCQDEPEPEARAVIDAVSREVFGTTEFEVWPEDESDPLWAPFFVHSDDRQVFEPLGWDVSNEYGRPMLMLEHFSHQLYAAVKGIAGQVPQQAAPVEEGGWVKAMESDAQRFRRRKASD